MNLNYLILWMMSPWQMRFLIILLKRSQQYAKSCSKKRVLQATPKLSSCTVALNLITFFSQYHVVNCLIWFLDRLWSLLDPIPASVLKSCFDLLFPFITKVVNCSLQNYTLTPDMKRAIVSPSIKKPSLDYQIYKNHRPTLHPDVSLQVLREGSRQSIHFPSARK